MDIATFHALLLSSGQELIQAAQAFNPRDEDYLTVFTTLCHQYPPELARAALETVLLRQKAAVKFPNAQQMYSTREALEQASGGEVSAYRSERYRNFGRIIDLGCSIGGDTLAFAGIAPTVGIDLDILRLSMAWENLRAASSSGMDLTAHTVLIQADLFDSLPLPKNTSDSASAFFFDPARRKDHRRASSVKDYTPPLAIIRAWLPNHPALGVKISPGVDYDELSTYLKIDYQAEIEFISLRGELKEAVLWFGPLRSATRRATLLPGPHTLVDDSIEGLGEISQPKAYLFEPDPAVLRAGLVKSLAKQLNAAQLDPEIAYLTSDTPTPTPFARMWSVEDWLPFNLKQLRAYLRQRGVGKVSVKKRGSPITPEQLIQDLRLKGDLEKVVFLTQLRGKPIVIISSGRTSV